MPRVTTLEALGALRDRPRRVLAVFAHPDDESYGIAGTLARAGASADTATALLVLTSGEASSELRDRGLSRDQIRDLREGRLRDVADVIGLEALLLPRLPDSGLARLPFDQLCAPVRAAIDVFEPQLVISHDPRGVNGHPDHIAAHWAVRDALRARPGVRFAMVCYPPDVAESAKPRLLFPTRPDQIDVRVALSPEEAEAKERCLRIHEALITIKPDGEGPTPVRPAIEHYDLLGEAFSPSLEDLFERLDGGT
jgi:LmbE family N-acetylglucosaminyl deacetylase